MRDYGRVAPTFWTRGSGKKLRGNPKAQIVALYLFTSPASSMIGIYHLAIPTMAHEVGLTIDEAERALAEVCAVGIAQYDAEEELLYLPEGGRYQIGERLKPGDKRVRGIEAALAQLGRHPFALDFAQRYAVDFCLRGRHEADPAKGSEAHREPDDETPEGASKVLPVDPGRGFEARQGKDQDQASTEDTHTSRAGVRARDVDQVPPSDTHVDHGACSLADFEELLGTVPALADVVADRGAVAGLHEGFVMVHKGRATLDLARRAVGVFVAQGVPPERLRARTMLGKFLGNQYPQRTGRGDPAMHPDARRALEVFGEVWAKRKRAPFVASDGDEEHAAALAERARHHATQAHEGSAIVRHWAERYLADTTPFVADQDHPLRLLPSRLTSYGLPKAKGTPRQEPSTAEPPRFVPAPPDLAAKLTGSVGAGGVPTTPGTRA